jgi:hypothetical protein
MPLSIFAPLAWSARRLRPQRCGLTRTAGHGPGWEAIGSKLFAKAGQGDVNAPLSLKAWAGLPGAQQKARRVRAGFWNQSGLQA